MDDRGGVIVRLLTRRADEVGAGLARRPGLDAHAAGVHPAHGRGPSGGPEHDDEGVAAGLQVEHQLPPEPKPRHPRRGPAQQVQCRRLHPGRLDALGGLPVAQRHDGQRGRSVADLEQRGPEERVRLRAEQRLQRAVERGRGRPRHPVRPGHVPPLVGRRDGQRPGRPLDDERRLGGREPPPRAGQQRGRRVGHGRTVPRAPRGVTPTAQPSARTAGRPMHGRGPRSASAAGRSLWGRLGATAGPQALRRGAAARARRG